MFRRNQIISLVTIFVFSLATQAEGFDATKPELNVKTKHLIPNAVTLQITPRGLQLFQNNLAQVLGNVGLNFNSGYFPGFKKESDTTYDLDNLPIPPESAALVKTVRAVLTKWLVGFSLQNVRPGFQLGDSGYVAHFNRFALVADEATLHSIGKTSGAVLAIELEIKDMSVATKSVRVYDLNNPFLGQVGLDNVNLKIAGGKTPLKVRLPFYVQIDPATGQLQFQAVKMENNINQVDLSLSYKNLVVPTIAIEINGHRYVMNKAELDNELSKNMPAILVKVRSYLNEFATQQLPEILNEKAKQYLVGTLEQVSPMEAPNSNCTQEERQNNPTSVNCQPLLWGLQIRSLDLKTYLNLNLQAYVEDNLNPDSALAPGSLARGLPTLDAPLDQYDIALTLNRGMINRILSLSYDRKLFEKIPMDANNTKFFRLTQSPQIDYVSAPVGAARLPNQTYVKISTKVQVPQGSVSWWKRIFAVDDAFEVNFDIIAKVRNIPHTKGLQILLWDVDPQSVVVDPRYIHGFSGSVNDAVRDQLMQTAQTWRQKETFIPGNLPLPPDILGIKMDINRLVMDPTGNLVMYLNYISARPL